jgi:hypothetical protein
VTGCSDSDPTDPGGRGRRCGPGDGLACIRCNCPGFISGDRSRGESITYCRRANCGHSFEYHMDTVRE